ncbi:hypothetical protein ACJJIL_17665 [Microbulbifer sp. EKSA005]|uniref:hypothetical protein n=1 Tax=Microbulbifer sp. EKSA005 TaxID=3243364 RepID=UPI0040433536
MGNLIFGTTTIEGRTFDDIKVQTSKAGVPRPIIFGKVLPVIGNIIATTAPKIVKKKEKQKSGKGGGSTEVVNEEVYRTYAIRICEGPITGISRVWRNNELVYDRDSIDSTQATNNLAFLRIAEFFLGDWDQMPSAVMQAAFGVSEVHAYRGTCYMVIDNENLTSTGGAIPQFAFEVERAEGVALTSKPYALEFADALKADFVEARGAPEALARDSVSAGFAGVSGELRSIKASYENWSPEKLESAFVGVAGELRSLLTSYDLYSPESVSSQFVSVAGDLQKALISYDQSIPDNLSATFVGVTGDLT